MKRLVRLLCCSAIAAIVMSSLSACEQAPPAPAEQPKVAEKAAEPVTPGSPTDTGLVPGSASTGNPPLIPHEVSESDGGAECLDCHKDGEDAPKIPDWHATLTDCRQCHVVEGEQVSTFKTSY